MVVDDEPDWVADVVVPVRETLTFLVFFGVTLRLAGRLRGASRLVRLTLSPVLVVAVLRCAVLCAALFARRIAPDSTLVGIAVWTLAFGLPAMAVAFVVGLARRRRFDAAAMRRLAARLRDLSDAESLRSALADAFGDQSLELVYRLEDGGGWRDAAGTPVVPPAPGPNRCVTLIRDGDRVVAAMTHDAALRDDRAFVDSATSYALVTLDNQRLAAQASRLVKEIDESRARIQRTAHEERRRLEQDLHDGAQQRLVALRIQLELAAERFDGANGDAAGEAKNLRELGAEVERALDELRSLARGIYPPVLTDRGLVDALRSAAAQAPMTVSVLSRGASGRYPAEVESAAYFCCLEALQNAAKHAAGATAVVVELSSDGVLCLEVRDDGPGFDVEQATGGMGMTSMRDRLDAVGGSLIVVSSPGRGTRVIGRIPVRPRQDAPAARVGDTEPHRRG
jgi:signal transduction histidine kinase